MEYSVHQSVKQLHHYFEQSVKDFPDNVALICDEEALSYRQLNERVNQLAHYLLSKKIAIADNVGVLLERSVMSYISMLAVLKVGACYVPIETEHPDERINLILSDLPFKAVLTSSKQLARANLVCPHAIVLDKIAHTLAKQSTANPDGIDGALDEDNLAYVIYTSGSTGKPKGVEIMHRSICHYVAVAGQIYALQSTDRVYQGFSLAFDASMEELWMAFAHGAALVACTDKDIRIGVGLVDFLMQHQVTVFSTVPTLLSTLEGSLDSLRLLILGGEAATANLVQRWMRPKLRIINTYGPTEATVIATYLECQPEAPVTIGRPLPGYEIVLLDEDLQPVAPGVEGELFIGGLGLARGYVNRPNTTAAKFIVNPHNKSQRLYRTGDLGVVNQNGEIQFAGRVDDQVKLRGFRIELNEVETVIMAHPNVSEAVVSLQLLPEPALVAYLLIDKHVQFDWFEFKQFLKDRLPVHMIPSFFEQVDAYPLLSSGKVDRKALPKPKQRTTFAEDVPPTTVLEKTMTEIWEDAFHYGPISVEADFFHDLGGHSLLAARVISSLRKQPGFEEISILDLYKNSTIRSLAAKVESHVYGTDSVEIQPKSRMPAWKYYGCGIGQFFGCLLQYGISAWQLLAVILCYNWVTTNQSLFSMRALGVFMALFMVMPVISMALTIAAKWLLLGRVKPGKYPVWGAFYFRWWLVQRLEKNIVGAKYLTGTVLLNWYYRLLGAKIGRNCYIGTASVQACDVISIGNNTSIGCDAKILSYIIEDGWLTIGTVNIGDDCFVGARSLVHINTVMEDHAVLENMSMLPAGCIIGKNQFFAGSPAVLSTTPVDHVTRTKQAQLPVSVVQEVMFGVLHYLALVVIGVVYYACYLPGILLLCYFYDQHDYLATLVIATPLSAILFLGLHFFGIFLCKKVIMNRIKPGTYSVKSLYYLRQWTIVKMLGIDEVSVLADSLYFPLFMRCLGAKIGKRVEMGEAPHAIPDLIHIDENGFTASLVAMGWPDVYHGRASFAPVTIGKKSFVGNLSLLPAGSELGDKALLGCMSIPPHNRIEPDASWFGSPPVFLPKREVMTGFSEKQTLNPPVHLVGLRLLIEFIRITLPTMFSFAFLFNMFYVIDYFLDNTTLWTTIAAIPLAEFAINLGLVAVLVGLKWALLRRIKPATKPVWDLFIWNNDLREYSYTYFINQHLTNFILGTPFVGWLFRAMGAKVGRRVLFDSAEFAEFDLISIGDDVCINTEALIQTHLYEDRIFKLSQLVIEEGCNVGAASIVLYDTVMEKNSTLGSLSLLMKGEVLPENSRWEGVPAQRLFVKTDQGSAVYSEDVALESTDDSVETGVWS